MQRSMRLSKVLLHMCSRQGLQMGMALLLLLAPSLSLHTQPSYAETTSEPAKEGTAVPTAAVSEDAAPADPEEQFQYGLEDRKDPFVPFLTEKAATSSVDMNEIVDSTAELTGMQLFEPGQLQLVALLRNGSQDMAMVEDVTGKGYVIEEGTKIGRRGIVKDIIPNKVLIEETAVTRAGKKIVTQIVMVLKKEGEE